MIKLQEDTCIEHLNQEQDYIEMIHTVNCRNNRFIITVQI